MSAGSGGYPETAAQYSSVLKHDACEVHDVLDGDWLAEELVREGFA